MWRPRVSREVTRLVAAGGDEHHPEGTSAHSTPRGQSASDGRNHFFWEDDIDFPEDNAPCDRELMWVQYGPDKQQVERFWTYFHGRILSAGDAGLADARRNQMRLCVNT